MNFSKIGSVLFMIFILLLSGVIALKLFFEDVFNDLIAVHFVDREQTEEKVLDSVAIAGVYEIKDLNLSSLDPAMRFPASQIYEALVELDDDLGVTPSLALSWGEIAPQKWQFRLREGIKFHDESIFDADDVVHSFEKAKSALEDNDMQNLLSSVKSVEKTDERTLVFDLESEDPLFLMKISYLLIESSNEKEFNGTGRFEYDSIDKNALHLSKNDEYWDEKADVLSLKLVNEPDVKKRLKLLKNMDVEIAASLPSSSQGDLNDQEFRTLSLPRLEMYFLIFNSSSDLFKDETLKKAVILAVDRDGLEESLDDAVLPLYQFSPRGVLGANPKIKDKKADLYQAGQILEDRFGAEKLTLNVHTLYGAAPILDYLRADLANIGVNLDVRPLKWVEAQESLKNGEADLYLLSWKFNLPDISEFLKVFVHSQNSGFGTLNGGNYENEIVDELIENSLSELDVARRNVSMQSLMKMIVEDEPFGVPLLELRSVYGFKKDLNIEPNLDGSIDLSNLTKS